MPRKTARDTRRAAVRETANDRFEFARRHIVQQDKLQEKVNDAYRALRTWKTTDANGNPIRPANTYLYSPPKERRAKTPEEREELKALEAAYVDARARLLLHENDGREL